MTEHLVDIENKDHQIPMDIATGLFVFFLSIILVST